MKPTIQNDLSVLDFYIFFNLLDKTLKVEKCHNVLQQHKSMSDRKMLWQHQNNQNHKFCNNKRFMENNQRPVIECPRWGKSYELKNYPLANRACLFCGEKEHLIANCPKRTSQPPNNQGCRKGQRSPTKSTRQDFHPYSRAS